MGIYKEGGKDNERMRDREKQERSRQRERETRKRKEKNGEDRKDKIWIGRERR